MIEKDNRVLPPGDQHNEKLRDHVHPVDWPTKPRADRYDMISIGAGTAGLVSSGGAAMLGARAALIERHLMGGDCLVTGCVPSKTLIKSAEVAHTIRNAEAFGIRAGDVEVDFPAVMERLRRVRADMAHHDGAQRLRSLGVDVLFGTAKFTSPTTLDLDGQEIKFRRAMICTGGRPFVPDIPGLRDNCLTSETFFEQTELPRRLLVLGGGPIGCELAQTMQRLGSAVTMLVRGSRLMTKDDPAAGEIVTEVFAEEGLNVRFQTNLKQVQRKDGGLECRIEHEGNEELIFFDKILVAAGRRPNIEGLGLEHAHVDFDRRGVSVDKLHRTSNRRIYAAGDVCSPFQFTHAAYAQAEFATLNALLPFRLNAKDRVMSWVTYTDPEVAHAGISWQQLEAKQGRIDTYEQPVSSNDRCQTESEHRGFAKLHCKKGTDKLVAATVVAQNAGEIIAELSLAITNGMRLRHVQRSIHAYPTRAEIIREAANDWKFGTLTRSMKAMVGMWLRFSRMFG